MLSSQRPPPLKAGDILVPSILYRFIPLGVISCTIWGLLFLAPSLVVVGMINKPDLVKASLYGENRHLWLYIALIWVAVLAFNLMCGALLARRRIAIEPYQLIIKGIFGKMERTGTRDVTEVRKVISTASMQGTIYLRYRDGHSQMVDCAGIGSSDLDRLAAYLAGR